MRRRTNFVRPRTVEDMREHARKLFERADALEDRAWRRMTSVPSPMTTGSSNYRKNFGKQNDRNVSSYENAHAQAVKLRESAAKWVSRADRDDPVKIAERANKAAVKAMVNASIDDFLRSTLKPGDLFYIGGNSPLSVKKVNAKSVTSESGTNWKYSEIATHATTAEFLQAYKAWKADQVKA